MTTQMQQTDAAPVGQSAAWRPAPGAQHLRTPLVAWLQRHDKAQRKKGVPDEEVLYAVVKQGLGAREYHALRLRRDAVEACVPVSEAAACGQRHERDPGRRELP